LTTASRLVPPDQSNAPLPDTGGKRARAARGTSNREGRIHQETVEGLASAARGFSHSLNNMLAVSQGNLALLKAAQSGENTEFQTILNDVIAVLGRAQKLSNNLAAIAHWREFRARPVSLKAFMQEREASLRGLLESQRELRFDVAADGVTVQTDPVYFELALNALVIHASEGLPQGQPIRVSARMIDFGWPAAGNTQTSPVPRRLAVVAVEMVGKRLGAAAAATAFKSAGALARASHMMLGLWLVRQFALASDGDVLVQTVDKKRYQICIRLPASIG